MDRVWFLLIALVGSPGVSAEIYKWVDADGKTHYADQPQMQARPIEVDTSKKGHINTGDSREERRQKLLDAMSEDRARENEEKEKKQVKQQKAERRCAWATDRLKRYERASYLYDLDKDGNRVAMSSEERDKRTAELRKNIQKNCH